MNKKEELKKDEEVKEEVVSAEVDKESVKDDESTMESEEKTNDIKVQKRKNNLVALLVALLAFLIVFSGITLVNEFNSNKEEKSEVKDNNKKDDDKSQEVKDEDIVQDVEENESKDNTDCTGEEVPIEITESMKKELNKIANIYDDQGFCSVESIFMTSNERVSQYSVGDKSIIIANYAIINGLVEKIDSYSYIDEETYKTVASKYGFTESIDTIFSDSEKKNGKYQIPPFGCISDEIITHNVTYQDTGNTISVVDNAIITNSQKQVRKIKVIYTFIYSGEADNINFYLYQVNSEKLS